MQSYRAHISNGTSVMLVERQQPVYSAPAKKILSDREYAIALWQAMQSETWPDTIATTSQIAVEPSKERVFNPTFNPTIGKCGRATLYHSLEIDV